MTGLPLTVHLAGHPVVVVGAGRVAAAKVEPLLQAGADVRVVAPGAVEAIRDAAAAGGLAWQRRRFEPGDVAGAFLVVAATADPAVNDAVAAAAAAHATLCVRADGGGTAAFAAAVHRGPLAISVSTSGAAPALARRIREELADRYDEAYGELATLLGELRDDPEIRAVLRDRPWAERATRWRSAASPDILALIRAGQVRLAKEEARSCLLSSSD